MRRLNIILLVFAIMLSLPYVPFAVDLTDTSSSQFNQEIERLVEEGIIDGYQDNTFRPERTITRGEVSKILVKALDLEEDVLSAAHFDDVAGKWYQGYIGALYKAGIFKGTSDSTFDPEGNVTRQELAVILTRIFGYEEVANKLDLDTNFSDNDEVAEWAIKSVNFTYNTELMTGLLDEAGNVKFQPNLTASRELVAKLVFELKYNKESYEEKIAALIVSEDIQVIEDASNSSEEGPVSEIPSYESIVSSYRSELDSLESSIKSEISSLISQAKNELYNTNTPTSEIVEKYMSKASILESSTDAKVSAILSSLESELLEYGYDPDIVDSLNSEYESIKSQVIGNYSF